ncbi:MAG: hypothetical protein DMF90_25590 [Acidobacteria bacterium]|nr:MAG: hypothetical protein DMF90_25590 [Acidobacteriota bacterium]
MSVGPAPEISTSTVRWDCRGDDGHRQRTRMNAASLPQIKMMRGIDAIAARVAPALREDGVGHSLGTEGVPAG